MKIIAFNDGGFYIYPNEKERTGAPLSHFVDGDVAVFLDRATGELRAAIPVLDSVRRCSRGWIEQVVRYQSGDHTLTLDRCELYRANESDIESMLMDHPSPSGSTPFPRTV